MAPQSATSCAMSMLSMRDRIQHARIRRLQNKFGLNIDMLASEEALVKHEAYYLDIHPVIELLRCVGPCHVRWIRRKSLMGCANVYNGVLRGDAERNAEDCKTVLRTSAVKQLLCDHRLITVDNFNPLLMSGDIFSKVVTFLSQCCEDPACPL